MTKPKTLREAEKLQKWLNKRIKEGCIIDSCAFTDLVEYTKQAEQRGRDERKNDDPCVVCWTYSWAPFDKEAHAEELDKAPNYRQIGDRWEICQMCQAIADLHNQYRKGLLRAAEIADSMAEEIIDMATGLRKNPAQRIAKAIRTEVDK